jgi:hypothetical protein
MTRLLVLVEGQSEEVFVEDVLGPHLAEFGVYVNVTIVGKVVGCGRGHRGRGGGAYSTWKNDFRELLRGNDQGMRLTTLFDLYGLPSDFPGLGDIAAVADTSDRCSRLEAALASEYNDPRLIPYIQRHEFEALVLASLDALAGQIVEAKDRRGIAQLQAVVHELGPEGVNCGANTAPSKRLKELVPTYDKVNHGPRAISHTGLAQIRARCPRFDAWVSQLEALGAQT